MADAARRRSLISGSMCVFCCGVEDDGQDIRATLRFVLEDEGYPVLEAGNGAQELSILRTFPAPLIVLVDHAMPHLNGPDMLRRALEEPALQSGHAYIYITAGARDLPRDLEQVLDALHALALFKPIDVDELLAAVARSGQQLRADASQPVEECS